MADKSLIDHFRANEILSAGLAELLAQDPLKSAIEVAEAVAPVNGGAKDWRDQHTALIQFGIDRGYNLFPQVLRTLATPLKLMEPEVEATYDAEQEKEE